MLNDYSGSRSHRNGLLYVLGMEDNIDQKLTANQYANLESESTSILEEMNSRYPSLSGQIDFFTMETALCAYKKIFREHHGRYLGYYLDRQSEEIKKVESDGWHGIEWEVLWQAREETLDTRLATKNNIAKEKFTYFVNSGRIEHMDWMFSDEKPIQIGLEAFL